MNYELKSCLIYALNRMDAMGFSLERFDAVGRYRDASSNGMSIDDRGELPDGTVINGAVGLRDELLHSTLCSILVIVDSGRGRNIC
mgnify:CR=1 FL=1